MKTRKCSYTRALWRHHRRVGNRRRTPCGQCRLLSNATYRRRSAAQDACAGPGATRSADDSVRMSPSDRAVHDCCMVSAWASRMPCSHSPIRLQSPSDKLIFEPIHLRHGFSHRLDYKVRESIRRHMAGAAVTEQQCIVYGRSRHRTQRCYSDGELSCIEDGARLHS